MGRAELSEALRRDGERQVRQVWADAEQRLAELRAETRRRRAELRQAFRQRSRARLAEWRRELGSAACAELGRQRGKERQALVEQAWQLARQQLPELVAGPARTRLFRALAKEVPNFEWQEVRVRPDDLETAQRLFGAGRVVKDAQIAGGLLVRDEDARIEIDNRLETRLERCWPELLAGLLGELRNRFEKAHAAETTAP